MSTQDNPSCNKCAFLPLTLLAVSFLIILVWQLTNITSQRSGLQNLIQNQQQAVQQSRQVQTGLEKLVNDLLDLAQNGDADAKAIVTKFGIARQAPAPAATPAK
jgi:predicted PurR-regulated permease PerM